MSNFIYKNDVESFFKRFNFIYFEKKTTENVLLLRKQVKKLRANQ